MNPKVSLIESVFILKQHLKCAVKTWVTTDGSWHGFTPSCPALGFLLDMFDLGHFYTYVIYVFFNITMLHWTRPLSLCYIKENPAC